MVITGGTKRAGVWVQRADGACLNSCLSAVTEGVSAWAGGICGNQLTRGERTQKEVAASAVLMVHGGPPSYSNQALQRGGFIVPSRIQHFGSPLGADRYDSPAIVKALPTGGGSFVGWQRGAAPRLGVTPEPCLGFVDQGGKA